MIQVLAAFLFSYYFVNVAMIPNAIKKGFKMPRGARLKPFDCVTCLSVWVAAILYFCPNVTSQILATLFGAGFLGNKIK
jgi:hypothetical protein